MKPSGLRSPEARWLALAICLGIAAAGCGGCRSMGAARPAGDLVTGKGLTPNAGLGVGFSINPNLLLGRNLTDSLRKYVVGRFTDFLDIFEIGVGGGMGLGAQASLLVGFVGLEGGRYTWFGIFGADQIGVVPDSRYTCVGVPLSPFWGISSLFSRDNPAQTVGGRAMASLLLTLGFEDGIGGPQMSPGRRVTRGGYRTVGPFMTSGVMSRPMSGSGPVGASVAIGPIAVVARVRAAAVINFVFGFIGYHPFPRGEGFEILTPPVRPRHSSFR